ncbi:hypothetical protein ODJ79_00435 [Actinoplanes sp. KI2]|uniref:hypothetical protein n=1 Tax=Actinoplanes sp. KI2 TaxID=2983315 RepID=UPI0021D5BE74|nr:hypothetical protein [Actinoplanes sp. KI2]MCU7722176.1 hypothetical protein [Actinoplanes sp. KI2]
MKNELGQSVDHFKRAASLAAQETSATVGPKLQTAVDKMQPAAVKAKDAASSGWDSALATLTPLVNSTTGNVRQAGKMSSRQAKKAAKQNKKYAKQLRKKVDKRSDRHRGSRLVGYALIGTAIGVGAGYLTKRRRAAQWDEYDPITPIGSAQVGGADDAAFEPAEPSSYTTPNGTLPDTAQHPR